MSLNALVEKLTTEHKANPGNKIFINEELLIASVTEETGNEVIAEDLRAIIAYFLSGDLDESQESIYDGAVYACSLSARHCFNDNPEDDVDYEIDWLEQTDGSYVAEVRPN
jgi:hypothetical protein